MSKVVIEMTDEQKKLDEMANSENLFVVIEYVAKNPKTSPKTLDKLSRYYDEYTRGCVAQNPNTRPNHGC